MQMVKMIKSVVVIYGSDSSEWEVSVRSGEFTASQIDGERYDVYEMFARFGEWSVRAYRRGGGERVVIPEGERPMVDKTDFSAFVGGEKVKFDIFKAAIAKKAIPYCNIVCIQGSEMETKAGAYLNTLFEQAPNAVGGKLPATDFFYKK